MQKVIVRCKPDGQVEVEGQGIQGVSCTLKTGPFVQQLGQTVNTRPTQEMFAQNEDQQTQEIQQ